MKLSELLEQLENLKKEHGDVETFIHCDQEILGAQMASHIYTILWKPENKLMLCDPHTFNEFNQEIDADDVT